MSRRFTVADLLFWVAGGMRGDTFVTANQYSVDLCDTATFQRRRRLYEGPPRPNVWPAVGCLVVWLLAFTIRATQKRRPTSRSIGVSAGDDGKPILPVS
jgi:hypothetical protein